jgi:hypothetical protein
MIVLAHGSPVADALATMDEDRRNRRADGDVSGAAIGWDGEVIGAAKHSFSISEYNLNVLIDLIANYQYGANGSPYQRPMIEPRLSPPEESSAELKDATAVFSK